MADSQNIIIGAVLIAVALVGVGGLYLSTKSGSVQLAYLDVPVSITGADAFQDPSGNFDILSLINIQCKPFADSCSIDADIQGEQVLTCIFATADPTLDGVVPTAYPETGTLVPVDTGCVVSYITLSEDAPLEGAFGFENLGNVDVRVTIEDPTGCTFGGSCTREVMAHEQADGDCPDEDFATPDLCIATTNGAGTDIDYVTLAAAVVDLCHKLIPTGGLEVDFRYTYPNSVAPGSYTEIFTATATTTGVSATCS